MSKDHKIEIPTNFQRSFFHPINLVRFSLSKKTQINANPVIPVSLRVVIGEVPKPGMMPNC